MSASMPMYDLQSKAGIFRAWGEAKREVLAIGAWRRRWCAVVKREQHARDQASMLKQTMRV